MNKLSKEELIKALDTAEESGKDLGGILGETGIVTLSGAGSAAIASTLLSTTATTSVSAQVLGSSILGRLLGAKSLVTTAIAAPTLPVVLIGVAGIALASGLIYLVKSGTSNDNKRKEYIIKLREKIYSYEATINSASDNDYFYRKLAKLSGIYATLLKLDAITTEQTEKVFLNIKSGLIDMDFAFNNAKSILNSIKT